MSTFTTTVEGSTLAEIEQAVMIELRRFFAGTFVLAKDHRMEYRISPALTRRDGDGSIAAIIYQAEVTVTW